MYCRVFLDDMTEYSASKICAGNYAVLPKKLNEAWRKNFRIDFLIFIDTNIQLKEETDMRTGFASGEAGFAEHNEYIWSRSPTKHGTKPAA